MRIRVLRIRRRSCHSGVPSSGVQSLLKLAAALALLGGCSASTVPSSNGTSVASVTSVAGSWQSALEQQTSVRADLAQTQASVSGTGTLSVGFIPQYTGDSFTITSGIFTNPSVTFAARLGANPVGDGTFYYGTLSFSGTLSTATAMTGTLTFTPPRTATQVFASQTLAGVTLRKQ